MDRELAQKAISAALNGNWQTAIELNQQLLKLQPENIDALNRLARACAEQGDIDKAKDIALKVLKLDTFNTIATKSLEKWKSLKKGETYSSKPSKAQLFLEEPGKTKIITLLNPGDKTLLAKLDSGDEVKLNNHSHRGSVLTSDGHYIGRLPDDLSSRLRRLSSYGNEYQAYIKSISKDEIKVFIRESKKSVRLAEVISFPGEKIDYISFTPPELVHDKEEIIEEVTNHEEFE